MYSAQLIFILMKISKTIKDIANNITPILPAEALEPGLHGGITTTGISGAVISFRAADGTTGHFNYVTLTFMP